jgi:hydroxymethylbilane synthase
MIRIGTRGSALALWQANHVKARLEQTRPGLRVELVIIKTQGDKILDVPLAKVGGKGLFVKEIEEALTRRDVDLAVHSMKDVPAELAAGLTLAAVSSREDPRDALCVRRDAPRAHGIGPLAHLSPGAHVGTSSVRRVCQLHAQRPDLKISPLRGNVDTRLRKLAAGDYDAIVLAAAGLIRLGHADAITEYLPEELSLPAIGQGVLGLETRADDAATIDLVRRALHDPATAACIAAERAFLTRLEGGCQTPMACHATLSDDTLSIHGLVGDLSGREILREHMTAPATDAATAGIALADRLLSRGAAAILARCRTESPVGGQ